MKMTDAVPVMIGKPMKMVTGYKKTVHLVDRIALTPMCRHHRIDYTKMSHGWWPLRDVLRLADSSRFPRDGLADFYLCARCYRSFRKRHAQDWPQSVGGRYGLE